MAPLIYKEGCIIKSYKGSIGNNVCSPIIRKSPAMQCKHASGGSQTSSSSGGSSPEYYERPYYASLNCGVYLLRDHTKVYGSARPMGADYNYYIYRYVYGSYSQTNWDWDDYDINYSSVRSDIQTILKDDSRFKGTVVYKSSVTTSLDLIDRTISPGSNYDDCYLIIESAPIYYYTSGDTSYVSYGAEYQYSYNKISDLKDTKSCPTGLSWNGKTLSWTRNSTGYPTVEFCPTDLPSYYKDFRTAARDVAYEVCCQGTETDPVSGESLYTRGKTRYRTKTIPVYYDISRASSSYGRQVSSAIDSAIDIINGAISTYGYSLKSKQKTTVSDKDASYNTDVSDTSFPNGITVVVGGNDELDAPAYNWGNWWDEVGDDGYIFRSKCLIYEDVDGTHPYMSDDIVPVVLEEMLESMGCGNDICTNPYSVFSDFVKYNKTGKIENIVRQDVYDLSVVRMTYSPDMEITESLEEAAIVLKPSRGQYRASYNSTSTRLDFLEPGASYNVKVWMAYWGAYSDYSSSLTVSIPKLEVSDLDTTRVNGGFKFSWSGTTSASQYRVKLVRKYDSYEIEKTTSSTSITITGLLYGVTYSVYVQPYNSYYEGDYFFGYDCTTAPAQPRATASVDSSGTITVKWNLYDTGSNISQVWINLYDSTNTNCLQSRTIYNSTSGTVSFDAVDDGKYCIRLRSMFSVNGRDIVCVDSYGNDYTYTITVSVSTKPKPWSWTSSNGSATATQTKNAYTAITNKGYVTDFSYLVWNDFVNKVQEFLKYKGLANMQIGSSKYGYSSSTTYTNMLANAKMSSSDKVMTAKRFNIVRYCIGSMNSTGLTDMAINDKILGTYFVTLTTKLNDI